MPSAVIGKVLLLIPTIGLTGQAVFVIWGCFQPVLPSTEEFVLPRIFREFLQNGENRIAKPPVLFRLKKIFRALYGTKTWERVFAEQFTDAEIEYLEAEKDKRLLIARWVCMRTYWTLTATVFKHVFEKVRRFWKMTH